MWCKFYSSQYFQIGIFYFVLSTNSAMGCNESINGKVVLIGGSYSYYNQDLT